MSKKIIEDIYNSKYSSLQEDINKILAKKANFVLESLKQHVGQNYFVVERTMQELDDPEDETRGGKASGTPAAAPSPTQPARAAPTGRGNYPVYPKSSPEAGSFRDAFAKARRAGETEFEFQGRKYNTRRADDPPSAGGRQPQPAQPRQQQRPAQPRQQQQPAQPRQQPSNAERDELDRIARQAAEVGREQARQNAERAARAQRFAAAQPDPARREPPAAPPRPQPSPGVSDNEAERLQQSRADAASRRAAELRARAPGVSDNEAERLQQSRADAASRRAAELEAEREREQKEIDDRTMS